MISDEAKIDQCRRLESLSIFQPSLLIFTASMLAKHTGIAECPLDPQISYRAAESSRGHLHGPRCPARRSSVRVNRVSAARRGTGFGSKSKVLFSKST